MDLLIDLFGYLSIVVHGLTILAQSIALGSVFFLALLARPLAPRLGASGAAVVQGSQRIATWGAVALLLCEATTIALQTAVLVGTVDLSVADVLAAQFAIAGLIKMAIAGTIAALLFGTIRKHPNLLPADRTFCVMAGEGRPPTSLPLATSKQKVQRNHSEDLVPDDALARAGRAPVPLLLGLALVELAAATLTTHAVARLDNRVPLLVVEWLHQFGAAIWIGGIPCFLLALRHIEGAAAWRLVGARFSRMSMAGVACILASGATMSWFYVGSLEGFYGTAYGVMVGAKIAMFLMLLGLGGMNFLLVERLRADPTTPVLRLRRFAEVEIGIGVSIFFAAASLTSVPPAVDLTQDRVSWPEIVERNTPEWPRLRSPDHDALALPELQAKLDAQAAHRNATPQPAFVPGSGDLPPRNAADIAWSEYNHHWSGLFVLAIGLLALAQRAGLRWARHWPLLFLGLGAFLFVRSDPETWPLGDIGFLESFRDVEVLQHRFFVLLIAVFAVFEWRVRATAWNNRYATLVFPLLCAGGGAMLLTHSHAIANLKDQLLIELTHTPLALAGIAAGWARWLELRLDPRTDATAVQVAGWVWPACLVFCGLLLLGYRET